MSVRLSKRYLPTMPAWSEVPQPMITRRRTAARSRGERLSPDSMAVPSVSSRRPRIVLRSASGCSNISFSMKCSKPPFSIAPMSQSTSCTSRESGALSSERMSTPSGVMRATSPSLRYMTCRVYATMADTSLATTVFLSPTPMTSGLPLRATTISPLCFAEMTAMPYVPSTRLSALHVAARRSPSSKVAIRCARTSVSVCEAKVTPCLSSPARREA